MTASNSSSVESENSVSQSAVDRILTSAYDPEVVQITRYAYDAAGGTTRQDLVAKTGLLLDEVNEILGYLEAQGYIKLSVRFDCRMVLLTARGERLAREGCR